VTTAPELDQAAELPSASWRVGFLTEIAQWFDRAALGSLSFAFDRSLVVTREERERVARSAEPYRDVEPARFFAELDAADPLEPADVTTVGRLPAGTMLAWSFRSTVEWFEAKRRDPGLDCKENRLVPVRHWRHDAGARATVVALHGFTMGSPRVDAMVLHARRWYDAGLDVLLMPLPLHGARTPPDARFSGEAFGSWDVGRVNEAVRQAVFDVHRVQRWLRRASTPSVGLFGLSLGGYVASLLAERSGDYAFVLPIVPAVCLATLPCRVFALSRHARSAESPMALAAMRAGHRAHSPLAAPLRVPKERILIIAGRGDGVVPPAHAHALWRHWGEPTIVWFGGSHFAPFSRHAVIRAGLAHVARCVAP
jgi:pimeloyl-ACP methyl ester carboxylesterase